jgi:hypothetical protein
MTPAEMDAAARELENRCPFLSQSSGVRSPEHNSAVGGSEASKHLIGMARDYKCPTAEERDLAMREALRLGFWIKPYNWPGLHIQGLPPGDVPAWWAYKYL